MQEHGAAAATDARRGVVVDLDDEIVEAILAGQPVAGLIAAETDGPVVVTIPRVLAPGVLGPDRARRQQGLRPLMAVRAPPQTERMEGTPRRAPPPLPLVAQAPPPAKSHCPRP